MSLGKIPDSSVQITPTTTTRPPPTSTSLPSDTSRADIVGAMLRKEGAELTKTMSRAINRMSGSVEEQVQILKHIVPKAIEFIKNWESHKQKEDYPIASKNQFKQEPRDNLIKSIEQKMLVRESLVRNRQVKNESINILREKIQSIKTGTEDPQLKKAIQEGKVTLGDLQRELADVYLDRAKIDKQIQEQSNKIDNLFAPKPAPVQEEAKTEKPTAREIPPEPTKVSKEKVKPEKPIKVDFDKIVNKKDVSALHSVDVSSLSDQQLQSLKGWHFLTMKDEQLQKLDVTRLNHDAFGIFLEANGVNRLTNDQVLVLKDLIEKGSGIERHYAGDVTSYINSKLTKATDLFMMDRGTLQNSLGKSLVITEVDAKELNAFLAGGGAWKLTDRAKDELLTAAQNPNHHLFGKIDEEHFSKLRT